MFFYSTNGVLRGTFSGRNFLFSNPLFTNTMSFLYNEFLAFLHVSLLFYLLPKKHFLNHSLMHCINLLLSSAYHRKLLMISHLALRAAKLNAPFCEGSTVSSLIKLLKSTRPSIAFFLVLLIFLSFFLLSISMTWFTESFFHSLLRFFGFYLLHRY